MAQALDKGIGFNRFSFCYTYSYYYYDDDDAGDDDDDDDDDAGDDDDDDDDGYYCDSSCYSNQSLSPAR